MFLPALVLMPGLAVGVVANPVNAAVYGQGSSVECAQTLAGGSATVTLQVGGTFTVRGTVANTSTTHCADPSSKVTIQLASTPLTLGVVTADSNGNFDSTSIGCCKIPVGTSAGAHQILVSAPLNGATVTYTQNITVTAATPLPTTGRDIALLTLWGIFLVGFGSVLISASWKRWRAARLEQVAVSFLPNPETERSLAAVLDRRPSSALDFREPLPVPREVTTRAGSATAPPPDERIVSAVEEASVKTSDLVSRLQEEIRAWQKPQE